MRGYDMQRCRARAAGRVLTPRRHVTADGQAEERPSRAMSFGNQKQGIGPSRAS
jgi:hypothetical protein